MPELRSAIRRGALAVMLIGLFGSGPAGCARATHRSPEQLRDAHTAALQADDPAAAYALLSPELREATDYEEFAARWKADERERAAAIEGAQSLPPDLASPAYAGTTIHAGGRVLHWVAIDDRYLVVDGLPGRPDTSTPTQAIRAFISAVRQARLGAVEAVLAEGLVERIEEDWKARVDAIETALEEPGALQLSTDSARAELRYEAGRAITLEQTAEGWRITGLR